MTKTDLKRIEEQADVSFINGQIVGNKVRKAAKTTLIFLTILGGSILATIFFFLYGFFDHKHKQIL